LKRSKKLKPRWLGLRKTKPLVSYTLITSQLKKKKKFIIGCSFISQFSYFFIFS
jgi:hypothetical protein